MVRKRQPPTWQLSLVLLILGIVVGYPSCVGATHGIWGGDVSRYQGWYVFGSLVGISSFLVGFISFLAIILKALTSPVEPAPTVSVPGRDANSLPSASPKHHFPDRVGKFPATVQHVGSASAALAYLRIALVGAIAIACITLWHTGGPPLNSGYGRAYWLYTVLSFLLNELPYVVAIFRTWKVADRAGLALAVAAGATQVILTFVIGMQHPMLLSDPWNWLSALAGIVTISIACVAWRPSPSRKSDVGILISIFFGFLAYTALADIVLALLRARMRV